MDSSPDHQSRSPEELRQILSGPITLPKDGKKFFSGKRLDELIKVYRDPTVVELDMMANDPAIGEDMDFIEYCTFLPEWRAVNNRFDQAGLELFQFLKQNVPSAVRKITDCTQDFHPGPVLELYSAVSQLINSLSLADTGIKTPFSAHMQKNLVIDTFARLTYAVIEEFRKAPRFVTHQGKTEDVSPFLRGRLNDLMEHLHQTNRHLFPWGLPGYAEQGSVARILSNNKNFASNLSALQKIGAVSEDPKFLQEQIEEKHELIFELLNENDFEDFEYAGKNFRVQFSNIRHHLGKGLKAGYLFKCKLILDPHIEVFPQQTIQKNGEDIGLYIDVRPGYYELMSYSSNTNLQITNGLSYELLFQDRTKYLQILNAIYQIFFDKLGEIDSIRMKETAERKSVREMAEDTHEQIAEDLIHSPEDNFQQISPQEAVPEPVVPEARKSRSVNISLRGRKGTRVLHALESILEPSVRCEGTSHFIFRGRSGKTYPISIHGNRDVGEGLLKKCLEMYGITRSEFADEY